MQSMTILSCDIEEQERFSDLRVVGAKKQSFNVKLQE